MRKLISAFIFGASSLYAAGGTCPSGANYIDQYENPVTLSTLGITSCYFVSKAAGADTNNGTTESTPWAHMPGMPSCASTCAGVTPSTGVGFILKGGDTWGTSDLGIAEAHNGTSSHPIYFGVDPAWFSVVTGTASVSGTTVTWVSGLRAPYTCPIGSNCGGDFGALVSGSTITINSTSCTVSSTPAQGSSNVITTSGCSPGSGTLSFSYSLWTRPILNLAGTSPISNGEFVNLNASSWLIWDDIEMTGLKNTTNGFYIGGSSNDRITRVFFHGWSYGSVANNQGVFALCGSGSIIDHNAIDGADSTQNTLNGAYSACGGQIEYNYFSYLVSGVLASTDAVHDNTFEHTVTSAGGDHCNLLFTFSPATSTTQLIYNNLLRFGGGCSGGISIWFNGNGSGNASWIGYGFGNVMYQLGSNPVNIGNHTTANNGTYYWFNNTVDCTVGGCGGTPGNGFWLMNDNNNQVIPSALNFDSSSFGGVSPPICNLGVNGTTGGCTDLTQTLTVANGQGYNASQAYPYSPVGTCNSSTCSTVQHGTNLQSYCTALTSLDANAGSECAESSPAGVAYNVNNNTVSRVNSPLVARPSSAAWDIGAYQFQQTIFPPPKLQGSGAVSGSGKIAHQ